MTSNANENCITSSNGFNDGTSVELHAFTTDTCFHFIEYFAKLPPLDLRAVQRMPQPAAGFFNLHGGRNLSAMSMSSSSSSSSGAASSAAMPMPLMNLNSNASMAGLSYPDYLSFLHAPAPGVLAIEHKKQIFTVPTLDIDLVTAPEPMTMAALPKKIQPPAVWFENFANEKQQLWRSREDFRKNLKDNDGEAKDEVKITKKALKVAVNANNGNLSSSPGGTGDRLEHRTTSLSKDQQSGLMSAPSSSSSSSMTMSNRTSKDYLN